MLNVDLQRLIQALDACSRRDLESAAARCVARGGQQVLIEDLLLTLAQRPDSRLAHAAQEACLDSGNLLTQLQPASRPSENRQPVFATTLVQWLQDALLLAHLELGQAHIDETALLLALIDQPLRHAGSAYQPFLAQLDLSRLRERTLPRTPAGNHTNETALSRFTQDVTAQARAGHLDPVLCRDDAIRQLIDILTRRRKNNPIVVGEAGVGKTALIEGLALRIAAGEVPEALRHVQLRSLDLGLLQAGAGVKGEFERRLQGVIDEVRQAPQPIILFIDEAHTLIGAGNQPGATDAANLLKPALARGELRTIAATTWSEYRRHIEKDPALARRFQPVLLHEPSVTEAISILRGLAPHYAAEHGVYLRDDAVVAAAELSARYLSGRQLPDKAVDLLDTACARVHLGLACPPPLIERLRSQLAEDRRQHDAQRRDEAFGQLLDSRALNSLSARIAENEAELARCESDWQAQREQVERLFTLRRQPDSAAAARELQIDLEARPAAQRLVPHEVCPQVVAAVLSQWTGIPEEQLARQPSARITGFAAALRQRLRGQEQAVQALDRALRASAVGLAGSEAPAGVFLLVGPSGVGKTETARALAELLYGGEQFLTTLNMGEFQERHSVARLLGAPPGYIGYGEGGLLTEAVRRKPYSVVLLDEVEKADPEVLNVFYQIFDRGQANDGEGRLIDFRNTLILLTSNLASERIAAHCAAERPEPEALEQAIRPLLSQHFTPALLARLQVVPYYPLSEAVQAELADLKLAQFAKRLAARGIGFSQHPELPTRLAQADAGHPGGARRIERLIEHALQAPVADCLLGGRPPAHVHATLGPDGGLLCEFA